MPGNLWIKVKKFEVKSFFLIEKNVFRLPTGVTITVTVAVDQPLTSKFKPESSIVETVKTASLSHVFESMLNSSIGKTSDVGGSNICSVKSVEFQI